MPSLNLQGQQFEDLRTAIQSALPQPSDLIQMLMFKLNKPLADFAPIGASYPFVVFQVITYAEAQGWTAQLVDALRETVPDNAAVFAFAQGVKLTSAPRELERKIRDNSPMFALVPFRTRLATLEMQICRIEIPIPGHAKPLYGTGFLLGPSVVMTNYHVMQPVIDKIVAPDAVTCRFDYKELDNGVVNAGTPFKLVATPDWLVDASKPSAFDTVADPTPQQVPAKDELDYAVVTLDGTPGSASVGNAVPGLTSPPKPRGWMIPPQLAANPEAGDPLFVLQHPEANPLQLALEMDGVLGLSDQTHKTRLRHKVNTEPGSSGSPCFNKSLELVALHHSGYSNFFRRATYNEAIPFGAIIDLVKARGKSASVFGPWN